MAFFLSRKYSVLEAGLLVGMTDIHTHLLPGRDDGVKTETEAVEALLRMKELGVRRIYVTPHVINEYPENTPQKLRECLEQLLKRCTGIIEIRLGVEYMLDSGFPEHLATGLITLDGQQVLCETSYLAPPPDLAGLLCKMTALEYIPVLAHPERYVYAGKQTFSKWKHKGCRLQLDLFSLAGLYGKQAEGNARQLLKEGIYDYVASDIHSLPVYLRAISASCLSAKEVERVRCLMENTTICF